MKKSLLPNTVFHQNNKYFRCLHQITSYGAYRKYDDQPMIQNRGMTDQYVQGKRIVSESKITQYQGLKILGI